MTARVLAHMIDAICLRRFAAVSGDALDGIPVGFDFDGVDREAQRRSVCGLQTTHRIQVIVDDEVVRGLIAVRFFAGTFESRIVRGDERLR